jgi:hypothetical protein
MNNLSSLEFKYTDEFGNVHHSGETWDQEALDSIGGTALDHIVDSFRRFLLYCEFSDNLTNQLGIGDK